MSEEDFDLVEDNRAGLNCARIIFGSVALLLVSPFLVWAWKAF